MGTIIGVVTTAKGEPIADASVMVESGPSHPDLAALTDESGAYRLGDLKPGRYVIGVYAEGFSAVSGNVPVRGGRVTRTNVTLQEEETPVAEMDDQFEDEFQTGSSSSSRGESETAKHEAPPRPLRRRSKN